MSLDRSLQRTFAQAGETVAIETADEAWRWSDVAATASSLDRHLEGSGIARGAVVALVARNRPAQVAALLALPAGGRCVAIVSGLQPGGRIAEDLRRLRPAALVAGADDLADPDLSSAIRDLGVPGLQLTGDPTDPVVLAMPAATAAPIYRPGVAVEVLTSGTTGTPKRIPLRFDTLQAAMDDLAVMLADVEGEAVPRERPPILLFHPLANVSGLYLALYGGVAGRKMQLFERFRVEDWAAAVERHRPRLLWLPPAAIRMVVDAAVPCETLAGAVAMRSGAAPLDPDLRDRFEATYGIPILSHYGASEFGGIVADWSLADYRRFSASKRGSVGRARPGMALRSVEPESGEPCAAGTQGLLEVLAPRVDPNWIRTTDLARIDADGFLFLEGRADDAINRGGFKILPDQVADVLRRHHAVRDVVVVGLADPRLGQVPAAAVVLRDGQDAVGAEELARFARLHLLAYQVPVRFLIVEDLPRTGTMKVDRRRAGDLFSRATAD